MKKVLTSARRHWRLRSATALATVGAVTMSLGVVAFGAATAQATAAEPCVPKDAWTQTTGWVAQSPGPGWYQVDVRVTEGTDPVAELKEYEFRRLVKEAVPDTTQNVDTWYSYNPAVDQDQKVETGYPVGDRDVDKANGWQVNEGSHTGQYADPNFKTGVPWQEGSGNGSWFFVQRERVTTPGTPAEYEYVWALANPGEGWQATSRERVVREYVPGTPDVTEYRFAFDHAAVRCDDTPPPAALEELAPAVTFTDPTCENLDGAGWDGTLEAVLDYDATGDVGAGETVTVEAMIEPALADEYEFAEDAETEFTHTFADVTLEDCVQGEETVIPKPKPDVDKPDSKPTVAGVQTVVPQASVPTAVAAGLAGDTGATTTQLLGQGLAVMGLVMMLVAGWIVLSRRPSGAHLS